MFRKFFALLLYFSVPALAFAGATPTPGQTHGPQGSATAVNNGDYVSVPAGLNTFYSYFIEVPPSQTNLTVSLFDADIGANIDNMEGDPFTSNVTYTLLNPSGTVVATLNGGLNLPVGADNAFVNLAVVTNPANGHWEVRVDMNGGNDVNDFGIRANDGAAGGTGTEYNVYMDSFVTLGTLVTQTARSWTLYPYITSGCTCDANEFDYDGAANGSLVFTGRTGAFTTTINTGLSTNGNWGNHPITGWTSDTQSIDYGLWTDVVTINGGNNSITHYMGNFNAANPPPTSQPQANAFRIYVPTDAGGKPSEPIMSQGFFFVSGANPPANGMATVLRITVSVSNPTAFPITFSAANHVTTTIPATRVTYAGSPDPSPGGTILTQPAIGGTGNLTWNPGTVAAGATTTLSYNVTVTPNGGSQRTAITGPTATGTTGTYVDETGNTTQARATYTFGPLCELAITSGTSAPTLARMRKIDAYQNGNTTMLRWSTDFEDDNLGFYVYREVKGARSKASPDLIAGSALLAGQGRQLKSGFQYSWTDPQETNGGERYWLQDVDLNGKTKWHGPITPVSGGKVSFARNSIPLKELGANPAPRSREILSPVMTAMGKTDMDLKKQFKIAAGDAVKIGVSQDGWYRITQGELLAAGLSSSADPKKLQLYADGRPVAIVVNGESDGHLDPGDSVEFFGTALDTQYSGTHSYWLVSEKTKGKRISTRPDMGPFVAQTSTLTTVEHRDHTIFYAALLNGEEQNFFGPVVSSTPASQDVAVSNYDVAAAPTVDLEVAVQGITDITDQDPDHRVRVRVNGNDAGTIQFDGKTHAVKTFAIPSVWVLEGDNSITLTSENGDQDFSLAEYARLTYSQVTKAQNDRLQFNVAGQSTLQVNGFTNSSIRIVDVTDPSNAKFLNAEILNQSGEFAAKFNVPKKGMHQIMAFSDSGILGSGEVRANTPSEWHKGPGADVVMIANAATKDNLAPLKTLRESQGHTVAIVDIEDIYDEFNFGHKSPQAIKDFLETARQRWGLKPVFVLLGGDASIDPRNYLGFGDTDLVPTWMTDTSTLTTADDDRFVDFDNDDRPDLAIGRLPARDASEMDLMVSKILSYEQSPIAGDWNNQVLIANGADDPMNFSNVANQVQGSLVSFGINRVDLTMVDGTTGRTEILQHMNEGKLLVDYVGHGSVEIWDGPILDSSDADSLTNGGKLFFLISMSCFNAYFQDVYTNDVAEAFLRAPNGGAVAAWSSSGRTETTDQTALNLEVLHRLFGVDPISIGEAIRDAKKVSGGVDVRRTWILLGDPAMKLHRETSTPPDSGR